MRKSAGLPLSVGSASLPVRLLLAAIVTVMSVICGGGGLWIADRGPFAARLLAIALLVPFGMIALVAAAFILGPNSRFGTWLDTFLPTLAGWRAAALATLLWAISALLVICD